MNKWLKEVDEDSTLIKEYQECTLPGFAMSIIKEYQERIRIAELKQRLAEETSNRLVKKIEELRRNNGSNRHRSSR